LATVGSRGDNEPFRALALEAASAGHDVFFAHTSDIKNDATAPYTDLALPGSMASVVADQGVSPFTAVLRYFSVIKPLLTGVWEATTEHILALKPDVVVYHPKVVTAAAAAHAVGAIALRAELVPMLTPTADFAPVGVPSWIPQSLRVASYRLVHASMAGFTRKATRLAERLGAIRAEPDITLVPVSPTLLARPADWPEDVVITGAWHSPQGEELDQELATFLEFGPILYVGFGSMKDSHGARRAEAIINAARSMEMKILLVTGWGGVVANAVHEAAPDILVRKSVSHAAVLPHCAAALHHGGAGTIHALLRSGTPGVIMPFLADQAWWAHHLYQQRLGPPALSRETRDYSVLTASLREALSYRDVLKIASFAMDAEDGLAEAVRVIEEAEAGIHPFRNL